MSQSIATTNWKLVSQYDNTGIRLMNKDVTDSQKMILAMSEAVRGPEVDSMAAAMGNAEKARLIEQEDGWKRVLAAKQNAMNAGAGSSGMSADLKNSFVDEAANRQKALDREVWAARARLRDEEVQKEAVSQQARAKTEAILAQARVLGVEKVAQAEAQKNQRVVNNATTQQALDRNRHDQAMQFIFQEGEAAEGVFGKSGRNGAGAGGGIGAGTARNLQQAGFALQDFTSQFQNSKTAAEGFGRGMAAISNNIQVMGAGMGPVAQASFAIGGAVAGIIVPAVARWLADTSEIEAKTKAIEDTYKTLKPLAEGFKDAGGFKSGKDAQKQIDNLVDKQSQMTRASKSVTRKIQEELAGDNDPTRLGALRKHLTDITNEYAEAEVRLEAIREEWGPVRLKEAIEKEELAKQEEKNEKARSEAIEEIWNKDIEAAKKTANEELRAEDEKIRRQYDVRQADIKNKIEDLREMGITSNGSSAAGIRGTGAATSAINRAVAGTASVENDRKHQIKILEDSLRVLQRLEQKMNFKKAGLGA